MDIGPSAGQLSEPVRLRGTAVTVAGHGANLSDGIIWDIRPSSSYQEDNKRGIGPNREKRSEYVLSWPGNADLQGYGRDKAAKIAGQYRVELTWRGLGWVITKLRMNRCLSGICADIHQCDSLLNDGSTGFWSIHIITLNSWLTLAAGWTWLAVEVRESTAVFGLFSLSVKNAEISSNVNEVISIVKPETLLKWHRMMKKEKWTFDHTKGKKEGIY